MEISVNYLTVLLAAASAMVVGFLWYAPFLFGRRWAVLKGYTPEALKAEQQKMGKSYALGFLVTLIMAYVLAHVSGLSQAFYHYGEVQSGITSGFWMWLGFVMPVQVTAQIFGEKKWQLFAIDTGYQLVSLLAMGTVIGLMP
jgi:hypothetical protein